MGEEMDQEIKDKIDRIESFTRRIIGELECIKNTRDEGPGTVSARWHFLMDELASRFEVPFSEQIRSDRSPERWFLNKIDELLRSRQK